MLLLFALQGALWLGDRSLPRVWEAQDRLAEIAADNVALTERNYQLITEIEDLKAGRALEERARMDLGMIKPDESFFVVVEPSESQSNEP
ncbi:MAG: septum formation initiator family protein [Gammaproteobacteria bacterium]